MIRGIALFVFALNGLAKDIDDVVAVDASLHHVFVLTREGKSFGWRITGAAGNDRPLNLEELGEDIVEIASSNSGVYALDQKGQVWFANDTGGGKAVVTQPRDGTLKNIRRIWAGGHCGVALDKDGKLYAWAPDHAGVGFVEKIEALKGFKKLAVMDVSIGETKATHALWIE